MAPRLKKTAVLAAVGILLVAWYTVRYEGEPEPLDPVFVGSFAEAPVWYPQPTLLQHRDEPRSVYVVTGKQTPDSRFEAVRVDVASGKRAAAHIRFGPDTPFVPFDSAQAVGTLAIELHGVSLRRPTFHLLSFPSGGGPGFHAVDSATGVARVVTRTGKTLLTRTLINSRALPEMRAAQWSDRARRLAAFLVPRGEGWTLYLFSVTTQA